MGLLEARVSGGAIKGRLLERSMDAAGLSAAATLEMFALATVIRLWIRALTLVCCIARA